MHSRHVSKAMRSALAWRSWYKHRAVRLVRASGVMGGSSAVERARDVATMTSTTHVCVLMDGVVARSIGFEMILKT